MPWRCPVCQLPIERDPAELRPRFGAIYRCHICRLELILDETATAFRVVPIGDNGDTAPQPPQR